MLIILKLLRNQKFIKLRVQISFCLFQKYKKEYKKFKKSLTSEQRKQNDKEVETWRSNAKARKSPVSKFDWGDLAKDRKNADYKIFDYYQRNGKSFIEDHNDQYLSQWTKLLKI